MSQNIKLVRMSGEFTRPSNTTSYAANKIVSDSTTSPTALQLFETTADGNVLPGLIRGGSYQIKSVELCKNTSGTTNASFDVWLYSSGIIALADNANFTPSYESKNIRIGKTTVIMNTGDTNSTVAEGVNTDVDHLFVATGASIYARVVSTSTYSPVSGERFYIKILLFRLDS